MSKWSDIKMYDLTIPLGINTPPWPTYEPLQMKFFKRLAPNGANGQLITHSNHVGTHLDGPLHFDTAGRDIASLELTKLCAPGVVVDLRDQMEDYGIPPPPMSAAICSATPAPPWTSSSGFGTRRSSGSAWTAAPPTTP